VRILVVERCSFTAFALAEGLAQLGHDVLGPVRSSREADAITRSGLPEMAIVEVDLEQRDEGLALAQRLSSSLVNVFLMTTRPELAQVDRRIAMGLIAKPVCPEVVAITIRIAEAVHRGERVHVEDVPAPVRLFVR
jgi:AmiR/NasT family two-component response regulator